VEKADPFLALKFRTKVIPAHVTRTITNVFRPLFHAPVVAVVLVAFIALDVWVLGIHGIAPGVRHMLYQPAIMLLIFAGIVIATTFHEIGHATACRYGGAEPGVMGVGIYVVWPAFYTDVTDAYRLEKRGRLRTDLGGVYFNTIFALAMGGLYFLTGFEPLLVLVLLQNFAVLQQLLPLLRLDGYYILTDLTGVPDLLSRMKPILRSMVPGRDPDPKVTELKPWVRWVVTGYIALLVPILLGSLVMMAIAAPRIFATAYDSLGLKWDRASAAFGKGDVVGGLANGLQMLALCLPVLGIVYSAVRVGRQSGTAAWNWSAGRPARRAVVVAVAGGAAVAAAALWWPNGEYRPIQPGDRGTLAGGVRSLGAVPTGRPALTEERERELGGAPTERSKEQRKAQEGGNDRDTPGTSRDGARPGAEATPDATPEPGATATPTPAGTSAPSGAAPAQPPAATTAPAEATPTPAQTAAPTPTPTPTATPAATPTP
jgi:putative peptide zinc metalloprotease protein